MEMIDSAQSSQSDGAESPLKKSNGADASDNDSGAESDEVKIWSLVTPLHVLHHNLIA